MSPSTEISNCRLKLTSHHHLMPWFRMYGALPPLYIFHGVLSMQVILAVLFISGEYLFVTKFRSTQILFPSYEPMGGGRAVGIATGYGLGDRGVVVRSR
jgi:hypothetical protein